MSMLRMVVCLVVGGVVAATAEAQTDTDVWPDEPNLLFASYSDDSAHAAGHGYFSLTGGIIFPDDTEVSSINGIGVGRLNDIDLDTGWSVAGAIGLYGDPLRLEVETAYRTFDIGGATINGFPGADATGDVDAVSIMVNLFWDIELHERVDLYVGGGVGGNWYDGSARITDGVNTARVSGSDWVFAYQVLAGVAIEVHPNVALTVGYRGFTTEDPEFDGVEFDAPWIHSAEVGVRFAF